MAIWKYTIVMDTEEPATLEGELKQISGDGRGKVCFFRADTYKTLKDALLEWVDGIESKSDKKV